MMSIGSVLGSVVMSVGAASVASVCLAAGGAPLLRQDLGQDFEQSFLGFDLGAEIRYALERDSGERPPIAAQWGMQLEEIDRAAGVGVFDLTYVVGAAARSGSSVQGRPGAFMASSMGRAWVNGYGFPLRVQVTTQRNTPMGLFQYEIEYLYDADEQRFVKEFIGVGKTDDQKLDLEDYPGIDTEGPLGLYLFAPIEADCVGMARRMAEGAGSGSGLPAVGAGGASSAGAGGGAGGDVEDQAPPCLGREIVFANPGLLALTMPALWETGTGGLDFVTLAPTGFNLAKLMNPAGAGGGGGLSVGGVPLSSLFGGLNVFDEAEDALQTLELNADGDLLEIELGGRTLDAWRLEASAPLESVYVDGSGSILRLDLPPDPETGERFMIRRLRPSEY